MHSVTSQYVFLFSTDQNTPPHVSIIEVAGGHNADRPLVVKISH